MESTRAHVQTRLGLLHVVTTGSGDPMVMWPSLLMDAGLWDAQVAHFGGDFLTIAVDPPGHGRSSRLERRFTFEECAGCVVDVLDHLGLPRTHFLGNSWGAMIGGTLAAAFPDRVKSAVLMNGTASSAPIAQRLQYRTLLLAIRVLGGIRPPLTRSVVRAFLGPTTESARPQVVRQVLDVARRNDPASIIHAVRSVVIDRPDQRDLFASITCPTLIVGGREDRTFPVPELAAMADAIPDSELVVIDGAAHLAAAEIPDEVNRLVENFLAGRGATSD
ncbi:alpha/beta fold hydrolase [Nocardia araoensis]|uniref:alpha/beta fold hydrolase n=1 Tax=Nocardia araoensis TaxID=228600 RepID=UPI0002D8E217|nr:alpha/beta fold hydrolase [Nocardia araoensis]